MFLQFWHLCNTQGRFFGLLMLCGYAEDSWELWVLILVSVFLRYVFFVFILDAIFCGTNFFIFLDCVAREEILMCSLLLHSLIFQLSDRYWSGFALWWFFVRKKLSSQIESFHWLLVLATECFFSFDILEIHSDMFWVVNALLVS